MKVSHNVRNTLKIDYYMYATQNYVEGNHFHEQIILYCALIV